MAKRTPAGYYKLRFKVLQRDNFTCQYCGRAAPDVVLHVDHRTPFAEGGPTDEDNLVTCCSACNLGKAGLMLEMQAKLAVSKRRCQHQDEPCLRNVFREGSCRSLILKELAKGARTTRQLSEFLELRPDLARVRVNDLKVRGRVRKTEAGEWALVEADSCNQP